MKLAISNIAWQPEHDAAVRHAMQECGATGVELAPTKVFAEPTSATHESIAACRAEWESAGFAIVALQALLFGHPELTLFGSASARAETLRHLEAMARIGAALGAGTLVFGSPKNRHVGSGDRANAWRVAVEFFRAAAVASMEAGVVLCIEPNPEAYGCDFITTSEEGSRLVHDVDHPGFGLHLDAAAMTLSGEDPEAAIAACAGRIRHFHVSEPNLGAVGGAAGETAVDHRRFAAALRRVGYAGWVSIEMRPDPTTDAATAVRRALTAVHEIYGPS